MNSAIGYSEGAEVPEDKTKITIDRIEDEAGNYCWSNDGYMGYIAGATSERNKAIDECIHILETHPGDMNLIPLLESLKNKPI